MRFAFATFQRVFDTQPTRHAPTLEELARILRRFELKPEAQERVDKELARLESAYRGWQDGRTVSGQWAARLRDAERAARDAGDNVEQAVETAYRDARADARRGVKRDLWLWSPAQYPAGATRGAEAVEHVSMLVLDYDDGTPIADASRAWESSFHLVHTTWSHRASHPKFRLILPLAQPVEAATWSAVWDWAAARAAGAPDPTGKSAGSTFALPVIPHEDWPHMAFSHAGNLLDPITEGVGASAADPIPGADDDRPFDIAEGNPGHLYLAAQDADPNSGDDDPWSDPFGAVAPAPPADGAWDLLRAAAPPPPPTDAAELTSLIGRLEHLLRDRIAADLALLSDLHARGALSDEEFSQAKARVLEAGR